MAAKPAKTKTPAKPKPVKTTTPGVYKRGSRYMIVYRVDGKQKYESFRTLDEARRAKAARTADIARGEFEERPGPRCTNTRGSGSSATRAAVVVGSATRRARNTTGCWRRTR